ncbi:MAG: nucleoside-diphosphate sugar epimerase, partial [Deltaproteobacteria bacterium]|nr:nucleoside-diphosphate sugar epimerase [Deltaproteobacteria bacterium]
GIEEVSILDLAKKIIQKTGSKSTIEMISYDDAFGKDFDDMQRRVPGIEKINKLIGFEPKSDLDMILDEVIKYLKN